MSAIRRKPRERGKEENKKLDYADNLVNTGRIISKILLGFRIGNFAYPKCPAATPSLPSTHSHYEVGRDPNEIRAYFWNNARINYIKLSLPVKETRNIRNSREFRRNIRSIISKLNSVRIHKVIDSYNLLQVDD